VHGLRGELGLAVALEVLVQRAAQRDVDGLGAAADAEHRHPHLVDRARELQLEAVERRLGRAERLVGAGAVGRGVEVRAAGQTDAVEALEQRGQRTGAERRQHDRHAARQLDGAHVGQPQRHLVLRRLAVAAERREITAPNLGGRDADERGHSRNVGQRAPILNRRMSSQYVFTMYKLSRTHPPDKQVLKDISLSFMPGAKIGVLGLNGSGKSTLLRIMAGRDTEFRGDAQLAPGATVGLLEQEPQLDESKDVRGNVEDGVAETRALLDRFNELAANYSDETADEFARIQERIDAADAWNLDTQLDTAMDALRLPPSEADVTTLSGGERRRVALCRLLLSAPDLLLLDEPTNHLDAESVAWLERHLEDYKGTVVAVTHDRYFLDNVAGWILELDRGHGIPFQGNYSSWLEQKQARLAQEEKTDKARRRTIEAELEWVRENPKGRRKKSKARLNNYERLLAEDRNLKLDQVQIHIPPGQRLGGKVIDADAVRKGFGDRLLIDGLSFTLPPAGIVGIIGANGAGKTTLFRMIVGEEPVDSGTLSLGETVDLAYVDQSRDALDAEKTVWEEISDGYEHIKVGDREVNSRAYVAGFNFKGSDQQRKVGALSGGERNRVHLAKLLRRGGNVLLLDEPTNDLDVDTLRALEEALLAFPGCAVIISHDRWFLDRVATHVLAFEGDSQVTWFEGNFEAYEENRRARLGAEADRPHRISYKKLVRS
jgi:sulfate-transporting ATPase